MPAATCQVRTKRFRRSMQCWYSERRAGIVFDKPLDFEELAEWIGKRLELASLKASYQRG